MFEKEMRKRIEKILEFINNSELPDKNKEAAQQFLDFMCAKGSEVNTQAKHLYCFKIFLLALGKGVTVNTATKNDIQHAVGKIESSDYSTWTKHGIKVVIKSFYKHYTGNDEYYPDCVRWIKCSIKNNKKLLPDDMLSEIEVLSMIKASRNDRDKCIVALLFDSGIRIGELLSLRVKDVDLVSQPPHLRVKGKTGSRQIPIWLSVPFLGVYLNTIEEKKPDDFLWRDLSGRDNALKYFAVMKMLMKLGKKAGIAKRVNPHKFRHSRATDLANTLTESQLRAYFGWAGGSSMPSTYVHLSGNHIDDVFMRANGQAPQHKAKESAFNTKVCARCSEANLADSSYCKKCGTPLSIVTALNIDKAREIASKSAVDPDEAKKFIEEYIHNYLMADKRVGKTIKKRLQQ